MAQELGWTRFDLPLLLGTRLHREPQPRHRDRLRAAHRQRPALRARLLRRSSRRSARPAGSSASRSARCTRRSSAAGSSTCVLPAVHPRMGTPWTDAEETPLLEPPGFLLVQLRPTHRGDRRSCCTSPTARSSGAFAAGLVTRRFADLTTGSARRLAFVAKRTASRLALALIPLARGRQPERARPGERAGARDRAALVGDARRRRDRLRRRSCCCSCSAGRGATGPACRAARRASAPRPGSSCCSASSSRWPCCSRSSSTPTSSSCARRRRRARLDRVHDRRDRPPVVLGGALPGHRRRHGERDPHPGRHAREPRRHDRRRDPLVLAAGAEPQGRPDPRAARTGSCSRPTGPGATAASARSSAGCSTRTWRSRSSPSRRPRSARGSRTRRATPRAGDGRAAARRGDVPRAGVLGLPHDPRHVAPRGDAGPDLTHVALAPHARRAHGPERPGEPARLDRRPAAREAGREDAVAPARRARRSTTLAAYLESLR